MACLLVPLSTLRLTPCGALRMTRGQDGLLFLSCRTLSFLAPRRFIPAHSVFICGEYFKISVTCPGSQWISGKVATFAPFAFFRLIRFSVQQQFPFPAPAHPNNEGLVCQFSWGAECVFTNSIQKFIHIR